jgi:hypothetical protein
MNFRNLEKHEIEQITEINRMKELRMFITMKKVDWF